MNKRETINQTLLAAFKAFFYATQLILTLILHKFKNLYKYLPVTPK